uniref:Collagen IV NC1 domain-containing protein n=1 Tax=Callorhinchus milii TaxID=7868 RepID=A0A4W3JCF4_CALMI
RLERDAYWLSCSSLEGGLMMTFFHLVSLCSSDLDLFPNVQGNEGRPGSSGSTGQPGFQGVKGEAGIPGPPGYIDPSSFPASLHLSQQPCSSC